MTRRARLGEERGAMVVTLALLLPVMLLFLAVTVDAANWWVHKRHLQIQADAAALAGGGVFQVDDCDPVKIAGEARRYSGEESLNRQVADDDTAMDDLAADPCDPENYFVDVTVREEGVGVFSGFLGKVIDLKADARVDIFQIEELTGSLPIVLRDERVDRVGLGGINDSVRPVSAEATLTVTVDGAVAHHDFPISLFFKNDASLTCASDDVSCYPNDTGTEGVIRLQGFPVAPTVTSDSPPALIGVRATKTGDCGTNDTGYFALAGCAVQVDADVDFVDGLTLTGNNPGASVILNGAAMSYVSGTTWRRTITLPAGGGPLDLKLEWEQYAGRVTPTPLPPKDCESGKKTMCAGVFREGVALGVPTLIRNATVSALVATPVHRVFGRHVDTSGLISYVVVGDGLSSAPNYTTCTVPGTCPKTFVIRIGVPPPAALGDEVVLTPSGDPLGSSSNRGYLACEPDNGGGTSQFRDTLALGCKHTYAIHGAGPCPGYAQIDSQAQPWTCVATKPGNPESALEVGMSRRIAAPDPATPSSNYSPSAAECAANPNRWDTGYPEDDRRIIPIFLASNPTGEPGRKTFPIRDFAHVYVTGWAGNQAGGPCQGIGGTLAAEAGTVRGYLIKYVGPGDGTAYGTRTCVKDDLGGCVPVLTR